MRRENTVFPAILVLLLCWLKSSFFSMLYDLVLFFLFLVLFVGRSKQ